MSRVSRPSHVTAPSAGSVRPHSSRIRVDFAA
ncbi:hypothetical protein ATKI12_9124, partial [Kitasatospora sp. Ki12]